MQADEQAIRAAIQSWHELTAKGDVPGVLSLMTEDAVFLVSGKPVMSGKAAFEKGLRDVLKQVRIESSAQVKEVLVSSDLACATTQLSVKMVPIDGSKPTSRVGPTLTIFSRANGAWLLKRDANLLTDSDA